MTSGLRGGYGLRDSTPPPREEKWGVEPLAGEGWFGRGLAAQGGEGGSGVRPQPMGMDALIILTVHKLSKKFFLHLH